MSSVWRWGVGAWPRAGGPAGAAVVPHAMRTLVSEIVVQTRGSLELAFAVAVSMAAASRRTSGVRETDVGAGDDTNAVVAIGTSAKRLRARTMVGGDGARCAVAVD